MASGDVHDEGYKFLGVLKEYNESKGFGMIACEESYKMYGKDIYVYKDVLAMTDAAVGDSFRFGIHVNQRGQPQASMPIYKVDPLDGNSPIGVPEKTTFTCVEVAAAADPTFLERLVADIQSQSERQNRKRSRRPGTAASGGSGGCGPASMGGSMSWGMGGMGGGGGWWGPYSGGWGQSWQGQGQSWQGQGQSWQEVTLHVGGIPPGIPRREVNHIFRQYAGFLELRMIDKGDHTLTFVTFENSAQAQFVAEALNGYIFDEEAPQHDQKPLSLNVAKSRKLG